MSASSLRSASLASSRLVASEEMSTKTESPTLLYSFKSVPSIRPETMAVSLPTNVLKSITDVSSGWLENTNLKSVPSTSLN